MSSVELDAMLQCMAGRVNENVLIHELMCR